MTYCHHAASRLEIVSSLATSCDGFFVEDSRPTYCFGCFGMSALMPNDLVYYIDDLGFFANACKTGSDPMLAYAVICCGQDVYGFCIDLKDPLSRGGGDCLGGQMCPRT